MACCRSSGMNPGAMEELEAKVAAAREVFPGTTLCCILSATGALVAQSSASDAPSADLLPVIASVKRSAMQFAATLDQLDCPVIHVVGEAHLFSCYDVGDHLLALYSQMEPSELDELDTPSLDARVMEMVEELQLLLQNVTL